MKIVLFGSNGLMATSFGICCNDRGYPLTVFGRTAPKYYEAQRFVEVDLVKDQFDFSQLLDADLIVYTASGGVQAHLKESTFSIYKLNLYVPVDIFNYLKNSGYKGVYINFGSYFEIGENQIDKAIDEVGIINSLLKCPNDYIVSKRMLTRFFSSITSPFKSYHFILPTIYGQRESKQRIIPYTLKAIRNKKEPIFTSGDQVRQYIYVDDLVAILFKVLELNIDAGIYNVPCTEEFTIKNLVRLLYSLHNLDMPEKVFGRMERYDVGMKVLQLDGRLLNEKLGDTCLRSKVKDVLHLY
jgi:nucleoside-diphosphate-sugar epimerase